MYSSGIANASPSHLPALLRRDWLGVINSLLLGFVGCNGSWTFAEEIGRKNKMLFSSYL